MLTQSPSQEANPSEGGFALLSVLWLLLLATIIVTSLTFAAKRGTQTSAIALSRVSADTVLESAFETIVFELISEGAESQWSPLDGPVSGTLSIGAQVVTARVSADAGNVDLNAAGDETLLQLFQAFDMPSTDAEALLYKVRDAQKTRPDFGKLATMHEVRSLFPSGSAVYPCLEPYMTVHSGLTQPLLYQSDTRLKDVFPDGITRRSALAVQSNSVSGKALRIWVSTGDVTSVARIQMTGNRSEPYWLYSWYQAYMDCST